MTQEHKSKTPRTDEFTSISRGLGTGYYQCVEFAKSIETELTSALAKIAELEKAGDEMAEWFRSAPMINASWKDMRQSALANWNKSKGK